MKSQLQEEVKKKKVVLQESNSPVGWEYTRGFLPKVEKTDSSPPKEPSN